MQPFQLIYIAGYGRSGSTILDLMLGHEQSITGLGELNNLVRSGWINNEYCSCGVKANNCYFWKEIRRQWEFKSKMDVDYYAELEKHYIHYTALPRLIWNAYFPSSKFKQFKKGTLLLYEIISKNANTNILVDSSKLPYRFLALKFIGLNPGIIHLVRDGRSVLFSLKKSFNKDLRGGVQQEIKPRKTIKISINWVIFNVMVWLFKGGLNSLFLRYEDLINNKNRSLEMIEQTFNIKLDHVKETIQTDMPLSKGHTIAGNRLRMKKEIKVMDHLKEDWRKELRRKDLILFNIIAFPLLKKYNYKH